MDLQARLKTVLRKKYQILKDAETPLIPLRLSYRKIKHELSRDDLLQHEFRRLYVSELPGSGTFRYDPVPDLLSCECDHSSSRKTVLTVGVSGIGKSTVVQSRALQWAEGDGSDIRFLLPFTFWELNLIKHELSLTELIRTFYPELEQLDASGLDHSTVWFVFDGLDEFKARLNFSCPTLSDVSETSAVDAIVTNLIRGNLLPKAHVWITARYSAVMQIPDHYLLSQTEVLGFTDKQKEQHFHAIIGNHDLAHKAMDHVKIKKSLHSLCQVPPICTIVANVLKDHLEGKEGYKISPLSLTQIYTLGSKMLEESSSDLLSRLKKLALLRMGGGPVVYEDDLLQMDISVEEASDFSDEFPLVLREETGLHDTTVYRFGHASIQEFLAASAKLDELEAQEASVASSCCQRLVDEQLSDPGGSYDVFLRFVFGLIKERRLLESSDSLFSHTTMMIFKHFCSPAGISLFYCLREYNSQALETEMQYCQWRGYAPNPQYTPMSWDLLWQRVRSADGLQENFELEASERCDEKLLRHLPDIYTSERAMLRFSNLTDRCCPALASVLSTSEAYLRELDLGYNSISDRGVRDLVEGLNDESCRLRALRLQGCRVTSQACRHLATALRRTQDLEELDLGCNEIGDEGLRYLSAGLRDLNCHLETLKLSQCNIKAKGCSYLASSLQQNPDNLKVLDLSVNEIGNKGANQLFEKFSISNLHKLEMYHCGLTELSCFHIREALNLERSRLVELNLSNNSLKDAGFRLICEGMYAWCGLEKLNVSRCGITSRGCAYLAKVLCSVSQLYSGMVQKTEWQAVELRDLDLSMNYLGDSGVKQLSDGLRNPITHLKALNLSHCGLTDDCCAELGAGLGCQENISELDLSGNYLLDKGVRKLCVGLRSPLCVLSKLSLRTCGLSSKSIHFLTTALQSNPRHLTEVHLMGNNLDDFDIRVLTDLIKNQKYSLEILDVTAD